MVLLPPLLPQKGLDLAGFGRIMLDKIKAKTSMITRDLGLYCPLSDYHLVPWAGLIKSI